MSDQRDPQRPTTAIVFATAHRQDEPPLLAEVDGYFAWIRDAVYGKLMPSDPVPQGPFAPDMDDVAPGTPVATGYDEHREPYSGVTCRHAFGYEDVRIDANGFTRWLVLRGSKTGEPLLIHTSTIAWVQPGAVY